MVETKKSEGRLIMFYGVTCVHCHLMDPLVAKLEKELGLTVTKLEVWENAKNASIMQQYDKGYCGGVPFFYNEKTGKWLCGETPYPEFKKWAQGK